MSALQVVGVILGLLAAVVISLGDTAIAYCCPKKPDQDKEKVIVTNLDASFTSDEDSR